MGVFLFISFADGVHHYFMKRNLLFLLLLISLFLHAGTIRAQHDSVWVDSVFKSLSLENQIAQLLIIRAYSGKDSVYNDSLVKIIRKFNVGGVCFFKGTPVRQVQLTNRLQQVAQTPLLVSIDAEWGLGMRLDSAFSYPRQMALGAIRDDSLIYEMGRQIAKSCQRMGIQINWAPVVDINNNPKNPVISFRSFGENPRMVARRSSLYMRGMQDQGMMAVAKHFPGHGDTDTDSHLSLPVISHSRQRMDSVELYPFRELIREGVKGVMVAHLYLPCYDSSVNIPATLSHNVVTGLLKEQMKFSGFIITDALDMQGVTKYFKPGEIEVKALLAGNDILLLPQNTETAIKGIISAIDSGWISRETIREKCTRILMLKAKLGLIRPPVIDPENLIADINPPEVVALCQKMTNASVTIIKNDLELIPLKGLAERKFALLSLGDTTATVFEEELRKYMTLDHFSVSKKFSEQVADSICKLVNPYDILILGIHGINSNIADSFGITTQMARLTDKLTRVNRTLLTLFGTPYSFSRIPDLTKPEAILLCYQDNPSTESAAGEIIFGGLGATGKLPVTATIFPYRTGLETEKTLSLIHI